MFHGAGHSACRLERATRAIIVKQSGGKVAGKWRKVAGKWRESGGKVAGKWRESGGKVAGKWRVAMESGLESHLMMETGIACQCQRLFESRNPATCA
jgi:hypothetical protein